MDKNIQTEIIISAAKEKVWNILTDFENYKSWNPFIIESTGKAIAGARLVNTMKNKESKMTFKPVILKVEKNNYFDWLGSLFFKKEYLMVTIILKLMTSETEK
ncbi:MAG: SRPBCC domain-containing protein [Bacteroidia bacterium]